MKSIIAAVITCAILFGVSFAASKYYMDAEAAAQEESADAEDSADTEGDSAEATDEEAGKVAVMPVSNRPEQSLNIEKVMQLSEDVRATKQKLAERELRLQKEEQRIQMLRNDLEEEQQQLQAFSESIDEKAKSVARLAQDVADMLLQLDERKAELAKMEKEAGVDDASVQTARDDKVEEVKGWLEAMDDPQAAKFLKELANDGKIEFAAALMHRMPARKKTKILTAMNDGRLALDMVNALKAKPKKRKK